MTGRDIEKTLIGWSVKLVYIDPENEQAFTEKITVVDLDHKLSEQEVQEIAQEKFRRLLFA